MTIIPVLGKFRQGDHEFEASLGYAVEPCVKENKTIKVKQEDS
jgi:hypothetical protein